MDRFVNQFSEIGKLNAVMLHRPGDELNQVTPDFFDDMLIDDTLYLPAAQRDHDRFAEILRENGAAVYYLKDLFCEVIANDKLKKSDKSIIYRGFLNPKPHPRRRRARCHTRLSFAKNSKRLVRCRGPRHTPARPCRHSRQPHSA